MPINPDDQSTWTLEQLLEHGSTAELEELLANTAERSFCTATPNRAERRRLKMRAGEHSVKFGSNGLMCWRCGIDL